MQGVVKSFSRDRGFGFITAQNGEDVFVHHTQLADEGREYLVPGQRVDFQVETGDRGPRAVRVTVTGDVSLGKERRLDWRGRRGGRPRPGELPQAARRARGLSEEEADEEEEDED